MAHKLAFIGFGGVGQGLVDILLDRSDWLRDKFGTEFQVVSITDLYKGSIHHNDGLDIQQARKLVKETGSLNDYPESEGLVKGWDSLTTIQNTNADTIIEITYTDVFTGQPAIKHCEEAFKNKKNVVVTNKGPVALALDELEELAKQNGVRFLYEGTVMSGTPALRMPLTSLIGNHITSIRGILNGTTNYMFMRMEEGLSYEEALKEAQEKGYAEADPTSDVEGFDVLYKVIILAKVVMGESLTKDEVNRTGMASVTERDLNEAAEEGKKWKMIGRLEKTEQGLTASVAPEKVDEEDPLAGISGATNAVTYECDLSGPVTLIGAGAGIPETGFALLIDLLNLDRDNQ
ncbi:homoserine dehydrogenase [Salsuginibacillus kocurii]|uniref:homoserine dehydrogenase n=1 Tax=Salsuginibacillus kocurii TaxID=427078 RepID=UPI000377B1E1|nr:homoserine dehydrogenase [Salsuginibacillus kocurii]